MKRFSRGFLSLLLVISLTACAALNSPAKKPQAQNKSGQNMEQVKFDAGLAGAVKERAKTIKGVEDSVAVVINNEISTGIKVTGFDRLRLKSIKEDVHKSIKDLKSDYKVRVTSDKKLFKLLQDIEKEVPNNPRGQDAAKIKSKFDKINKDMQG